MEYSANYIIQALADETADRRPLMGQIRQNTNITTLLEALEKTTNSFSRQLLCDLIGFRYEDEKENFTSEQLLPLRKALSDFTQGVRNSAADAIGKIGDISAGVDIELQYAAEAECSVKQMLLLAMGTCQSPNALALLIDAIAQGCDETAKGCAAWALGKLKKKEAIVPLQKLADETNSQYARNRAIEAIGQIVG